MGRLQVHHAVGHQLIREKIDTKTSSHLPRSSLFLCRANVQSIKSRKSIEKQIAWGDGGRNKKSLRHHIRGRRSFIDRYVYYIHSHVSLHQIHTRRENRSIKSNKTTETVAISIDGYFLHFYFCNNIRKNSSNNVQCIPLYKR